MKKKYIAIKGVRGVKNGEEFEAPRHIGRALAAVGRAKPVEDEYQTTNDPAHLTKVVNPSTTENKKQKLQKPEPKDDEPAGEKTAQAEDGTAETETDPNKPDVVEATKQQSEINATPNAIAAAQEHNVDINTVNGSGENGRVTKTDVMAVVNADENTGT